MTATSPSRQRAWLALLALTPLVSAVALAPGGRWLLPLLAPLTLFFPFAAAVRSRRYGRAWALGMTWAALLSLGVVLLVYLAPDGAADGILNGEPYAAEMLSWIATGEGREVQPARFLPEHALHLAAFLVLTVASGGFLGLALGAALVGYMSYFVASYAGAAGLPLLGPIVAWVPWSVVRVAAFVLLGGLAARPLLVRQAWPWQRRELRLALLGLAGIVVDVVVKASLAPAYGEFLRRLAE